MINTPTAKGWLASLFKTRLPAAQQSHLGEKQQETSSLPVLDLGVDPTDDRPVFGFHFNGMFIYDPKLSECGRFEVDPVECYGLTPERQSHLEQLNERLEAATEDAINAGALSIQKALGVPTGDTAGVFFSEQQYRGLIAIALGLYMLQELKQGTS